MWTPPSCCVFFSFNVGWFAPCGLTTTLNISRSLMTESRSPSMFSKSSAMFPAPLAFSRMARRWFASRTPSSIKTPSFKRLPIEDANVLHKTKHKRICSYFKLTQVTRPTSIRFLLRRVCSERGQARPATRSHSTATCRKKSLFLFEPSRSDEFFKIHTHQWWRYSRARKSNSTNVVRTNGTFLSRRARTVHKSRPRPAKLIVGFPPQYTVLRTQQYGWRGWSQFQKSLFSWLVL